MNKETILEFGMVFYEEVKHHFAEFVLNLNREIVKETEKILKAD